MTTSSKFIFIILSLITVKKLQYEIKTAKTATRFKWITGWPKTKSNSFDRYNVNNKYDVIHRVFNNSGNTASSYKTRFQQKWFYWHTLSKISSESRLSFFDPPHNNIQVTQQIVACCVINNKTVNQHLTFPCTSSSCGSVGSKFHFSLSQWQHQKRLLANTSSMLQKDHQKTEEWMTTNSNAASQQLYIVWITSTACGPVLHVAEQVTVSRYRETIYLATQPTTKRTIICQM